MQFSLAALVLAAAAFAGVHAQSTTETSAASVPTDISGISPCILTCITSSKGCSSLTDVTCFCTNAEFQSETLACLQKSCTAADMATVAALQKAQCGTTSNLTSTDASGSTTAPSSTGTSTGTGTGTGAAAATGSNAASALTAGVFGMGVAVVGAVFAL